MAIWRARASDRMAPLRREDGLQFQAERIGGQRRSKTGPVFVFLWIEFRHHCLLLVWQAEDYAASEGVG